MKTYNDLGDWGFPPPDHIRLSTSDIESIILYIDHMESQGEEREDIIYHIAKRFETVPGVIRMLYDRKKREGKRIYNTNHRPLIIRNG